MKSLKSGLVILGSAGLVFLSACSNGNQTANSGSSPIESTSETASTNEQTSEQANQSKGGQVVESGNYHLELVPESESNGTHLDLYLQKGENHEAIPNAKVTAQVQTPDGSQKTLPLSYDAGGKHYTAMLPGKVAGQYQVKVTSDINGEKVDGRFNFSQ